MSKLLYLLATQLFLIVSMSSSASMITIMYPAGGTTVGPQGRGLCFDDGNSNVKTCDISSEYRVLNANGGVRGEGITKVFAQTNDQKGTLKLKASVPDPWGGITFQTAVTGDFTVTTGGTFSVSMALDGIWSNFGGNGWGGQLDIQTILTEFNNFRPIGLEGYRVDSLSGSVDTVLNFRTFLAPGKYTLGASMVGNLNSGSFDFSNTGKLFIESSNGEFNFDDPNFLSDPAYLQPVNAVSAPAIQILMLFFLGFTFLQGKKLLFIDIHRTSDRAYRKFILLQ